MTTSILKTNWHSIKNFVLKTLDQVTWDTLEKAPSNPAHHLVFFKEQKNTISNTTNIDYLADSLENSIKDELNQRMQLMGYQRKGPCIIDIKNSVYILQPFPTLPVQATRLARQAGLEAASLCARLQITELVLHKNSAIDLRHVIDGFFSGLYSAGFLKKEQSSLLSSFKKVWLIDKNISQEDLRGLKALLRASLLTRAISDCPPNWLHSERFAEIAQEIAQETKIRCTIKGREEIIALGMGAFASVAQGTTVDPKMIVLEIEGTDKNKWGVVVGKGLTFDSGGLSLKPGVGMWDMKYDMCGGAAVLGAAYYFSQVKPPINIACIIGAVENVISSTATRPSDIVTAANGKTVEILNTDAEGRLVLCDLLHYGTTHYKPQFITNIATLTGAVSMALGSGGAGVMTNNKKTLAHFTAAFEESGEPTWELPLWPDLAKEIVSEVADFKNIASANVKAGSIVAGLFLKEFVGETPWIHIDIAGVAYDSKTFGYPSSGPSGYGLRGVVNSVMRWESIS